MREPVMKFAKVLATFLAVSLIFPAVSVSQAVSGNYPYKPIRMIVAYPPGGGTDTLARLIGAELGREVGQSIVIVNRGGASGSIGTMAAARAAPDGYTVLLATSNVTITPAIDAQAKFSVQNDFEPVTLLTESPFALVANTAIATKTLEGLITQTQENKQSINYASTGVGSPQHLTTENLKKSMNLDWLHVPYQGGGPSLVALIEGQVQVMFSNVLPVLPYIQSGKLTALAQTTRERLPVLPDTPTMNEAGIDDFVVSFWSGILAPKGTPPEIINKLDAALLKVMKIPALRAKLTEQGTIVNPLSSQQFRVYIRNDAAYWGRVAKSTNIKINHD